MRCFATLKLLVGQGLSIIFISHKLNEVMAVSDRVLVLRAGKLAGERVTAETTRAELAALMVGQEVDAADRSPPAEPGPLLLVLERVSTARRGTGASLDRDLAVAARRRDHRPCRRLRQRPGGARRR